MQHDFFSPELKCRVTGDVPDALTDPRAIRLQLSLSFSDDESAAAFKRHIDQIGPDVLIARLAECERILLEPPAGPIIQP